MGTIEDMVQSEIEDTPPAWPRCSVCDVSLVERTDPRTGKPIAEDGRAVMECPRCREVSIRESPRRAERRFTLIRWLVTGSLVVAGVANLVFRVLQARAGDLGPDSTGELRWFVPLILLGAAAVCLHLAMDAAARALSERRKFDARNTWWAYVVFWAAAMGLMLWMGVRLAPEFWGATRPPPATRVP